MNRPVIASADRVGCAGESVHRFLRSGSGGFSLVEVLIGLLVLEVGLLGVAGLVAVSGRILSEAAQTERVLFAAEDVLDSLAAAGDASDGERTISGGTLRWRFGSLDGQPLSRLRLVARDSGGSPILTLHALLPESPAAGEEE